MHDYCSFCGYEIHDDLVLVVTDKRLGDRPGWMHSIYLRNCELPRSFRWLYEVFYRGYPATKRSSMHRKCHLTLLRIRNRKTPGGRRHG